MSHSAIKAERDRAALATQKGPSYLLTAAEEEELCKLSVEVPALQSALFNALAMRFKRYTSVLGLRSHHRVVASGRRADTLF